MTELYLNEKLAEGVTLLKGIEHDCCCWLVEGTESALLIDTGLGAVDMCAVVKELTPLPFKVVNTHGHGDHAGGDYAFDRVYMHENVLQDAFTGEALEMMRPHVAPETLAEAERRTAHRPEVSFIKEGDVFDLGGRKLEVLETPGHTDGDVTLYDRENGLFFCGDSVIREIPVLLITPRTESVARYAQSMRKLAALEGIRGFCSGHDERIMPRSFLLDCIACADEIIAGTDNGTELPGFELPSGPITCVRAVHGDAVLLYDRNRVR